MSIRNSVRRGASLFAGLGLATVVYGQGVGCSGGSGAGPQNEASPNQTGTVGLSLTLLGGGLLDSVNYTITGPNGASTVVSQGSVNLQNSMALSFTVGGIPAGSNYSVALSGVAVGGAVTCSGSATFSVTARTTTNVTVLLNCFAGPRRGGGFGWGSALPLRHCHLRLCEPFGDDVGQLRSAQRERGRAFGCEPRLLLVGPERHIFRDELPLDELHVHHARERHRDCDGLRRHRT